MSQLPPDQAEQNDDDIQAEINLLEQRLRAAKSRLASPPPASSTHHLLLLADSALPIGSFAFSAGLESYAAHTRLPLSSYLPLSIGSLASTSLPYLLAAHRSPRLLPELDDQLDASTVCLVGRRASVSQGRALLSVWERSFAPTLPPRQGEVLGRFSAQLKQGHVSAHFAPVFGAVCAAVGIDTRQAAYVFVLGHVRALVSAAVRAGMLGPYHAHRILAGGEVQRIIDAVIEREWETPVEEAGQTVPAMDLWIGRHETLYSRIFNS